MTCFCTFIGNVIVNPTSLFYDPLVIATTDKCVHIVLCNGDCRAIAKGPVGQVLLARPTFKHKVGVALHNGHSFAWWVWY